MKKYSFHRRTDSTQEVIGTTFALGRLNAARYFAKVKQLPLKAFLELFAVGK